MCKQLEKSGHDNLYESCQDCGVSVCFDVESGDDVITRAYVTASGDLFCYRCGRKHDEAEDYNPELPPEAYMQYDDPLGGL